MENKKRRAYLKIGDSRLLNIKIILDDEQTIYEGMVEDAPEEIKKLTYSKVEMTSQITYYVYSELN